MNNFDERGTQNWVQTRLKHPNFRKATLQCLFLPHISDGSYNHTDYTCKVRYEKMEKCQDNQVKA